MPADYATLAPFYDQIGMSHFARTTVSKLVNFMLSHDWMGRRIIDLGCGTGASLRWLGEHGYILTGVDASTEMLEQARTRTTTSRATIRWLNQDIRKPLDVTDDFEMAIAINVLNELESLRELEAVFKNAHGLLGQGKMFAFDLYTIEGLIEIHREGDLVFYDNNDSLTVFGRTQFDYDRQLHTRQFIIFQAEDTHWQRLEARRTMRAYPVQAIASLLQRSGFDVRYVLDTNLEQYDPGKMGLERVIFIAQTR